MFYTTIEIGEVIFFTLTGQLVAGVLAAGILMVVVPIAMEKHSWLGVAFRTSGIVLMAATVVYAAEYVVKAGPALPWKIGIATGFSLVAIWSTWPVGKKPAATPHDHH